MNKIVRRVAIILGIIDVGLVFAAWITSYYAFITSILLVSLSFGFLAIICFLALVEEICLIKLQEDSK